MDIPLRQYWNLLVGYLKPQSRRVLLLVVLLLSSIGLQLVNPQLMRRFIDTATQTAQAGDPSDVLLGSAVLFVVVALIQQIVSVLATYLSENVGWTATNALRADLAQHCLLLDMSFHSARTPGEMIERIDGDVTALSNFFSQFVIQVFGNVLVLVGVVILLLREDWRVGLILAGFALLMLVIILRLRNIAVPHWTAERQASADLFGFLEERLAGTEDIRSCGAKAYVMRRFYQLVRELMKRTLKAGLMINILINTSMLLITVGNAISFVMAAHLFFAGSITIGAAYIIFHYSNMLLWPIRRITQQMQELQRAGAGITRIQELLNVQSKIRGQVSVAADQDTSAELTLPKGALEIRFQNVTFGYDDAVVQGGHRAASQDVGPEEVCKEIVFRDLSFQLSPRKVLGLLGRTGSGKTTLTRLLFRLYDPDSGEICLGDGGSLTDIRDVPLTNLRQRVGMVTQEVQLFHATVRDNMTFFDPGIPDERILNVIEDLGLREWYESLVDGLDTELESGGGGLSAGEAQLLAFTRIFLSDPGLVILDEASSRLDPATENLTERAVDKLLQNRTAIIIAHRLGTVLRADEIMILEDGRICEHGARSTLAHDPASRFYSLLQTGLEEVLA